MDLMKSTKEYIKEVSRLSIPLGLQQMVSNVVTLIDNVMVGSINEAAMSAVSIGVAYTWLSTSIAFSFTKGGLIIGAQDYGRGEKERIRKLMSLCLLVSFLSTGLFFLLVTFVPKVVLSFYTNYSSIIDASIEYLSIFKYSLLFFCISQTILVLLQAVKNVNAGFRISLASCGVNLVFNYLLIYGNFGFPKLGLKGAAIATLIARIVEMILSLYVLLFEDKKLNFSISDFKLDISRDLLKQLMKVTAPLLVMDMLDNLLSNVQTMITGRISENYISANSIVHNSWELPAVFCRGASSAASIIIGNSLGRKDYEQAKIDAKRLIYTALILGFMCSACVQVIMFIIIPFYNVSNETITLAKQMSYACSLNVIFISLEMISNYGIINASGKTKRVLKISLISNWFVAIPLGLLCAFVFKLHPAFIYLALRSGYYVRSFWALFVLKKGDWVSTIS